MTKEERLAIEGIALMVAMIGRAILKGADLEKFEIVMSKCARHFGRDTERTEQ